MKLTILPVVGVHMAILMLTFNKKIVDRTIRLLTKNEKVIAVLTFNTLNLNIKL